MQQCWLYVAQVLTGAALQRYLLQRHTAQESMQAYDFPVSFQTKKEITAKNINCWKQGTTDVAVGSR